MTTATNAGPIRRRTDLLVADFLAASTATMHERLGAVAGVAVTAGSSGGPWIVAASTTLAADVDRIQLELGWGPCLSALTSGATLYVPDLAGDERWGSYGPRAAARGAAACVSVPVLVGTRPVAVFKVYAAERDGLASEQRSDAVAIAQEITGGFALAEHLTTQAEELEDLTALMTHRRAIDLALGVLMERAQVPAEAAFGMLRAQSQQSNVKVHDVARAVIGTIPGTSADDLVPPYQPQD